MNESTTGGNSMRIKVDTARCTGHARCIAVAPRVYVLNDDGYNDTAEIDVQSGSEAEAEAIRGAKACPERAITVT
jgi:ferredoxin